MIRKHLHLLLSALLAFMMWAGTVGSAVAAGQEEVLAQPM